MTSRFDKMTVAQLKEEQKKRGILDSDIKGKGKNGSIIKSDRVNALDLHKEKSPEKPLVKSEGSGRGKGGLGLGSTHKAKAAKKAAKTKKSPPKKTATKKTATKKAASHTQPKKVVSPGKIFVLTYQIRGDHGNQDPTGVLSASTFEKLKALVQQYIFAHREDEDHIEDEDFGEEAVEYAINELNDAYKDKDGSFSPELNCMYTGRLFKNVPYQP